MYMFCVVTVLRVHVLCCDIFTPERILKAQLLVQFCSTLWQNYSIHCALFRGSHCQYRNDRSTWPPKLLCSTHII